MSTTEAKPAVAGAAAPVTVACPACNCPACAACPKCPDCGAPAVSGDSKIVVLPEDKSNSGIFSNPLYVVAILAALYFFLFHTDTGRGIYQQYIGDKVAALAPSLAPSAPPYRY